MAKRTEEIEVSVQETTPTTSNYANIKVLAGTKRTVEVADDKELYQEYKKAFELVETVVATRRDEYLKELGVLKED